MKVWWAKKPKPGNFGDVLTPVLLDHFDIAHEYSTDSYDTLCIGSIARMAGPGVTVLGSGIIDVREELNPAADWRFVRGPITRNSLIASGGHCAPVYGDPAMLLPLMCIEGRKRYNLGIVPHYSDYELVKNMYPKHRVIDVLRWDPLEVAREITECRSIVSSSLHGIICAHAFGIPVAWVKFGQSIKGDDVKFYDHYMALGLTATLSTWNDFTFTKYSSSSKINQLTKIFQDVSYEQKHGYQHELDFS